jgi:hypothetical protein
MTQSQHHRRLQGEAIESIENAAKKWLDAAGNALFSFNFQHDGTSYRVVVAPDEVFLKRDEKPSRLEGLIG